MQPESDVLASHDPIVWQLRTDDPLIGSATHCLLALEELAGSSGCEILYSSDDYNGYFEWRVRLPRAEHERRGPDGYPVVVEKIWRYLDSEVGGQEWYIGPHEDDTLRLAAGQRLRAAYTDLLDPLENALAPLRMDGAEEYEPRVTFWGEEEGLQAGAWNLRPRGDYELLPKWVVITAGVAVDARLRDLFDDHLGYPDSFDIQLANWADDLVWERPPFSAETGFLDARHPILLLPRPTRPTWSVTLASPSFSDRTHAMALDISSWRVNGCYQWTASDPQVLADQVTAEVYALLPHLRGQATDC